MCTGTSTVTRRQHLTLRAPSKVMVPGSCSVLDSSQEPVRLRQAVHVSVFVVWLTTAAAAAAASRPAAFVCVTGTSVSLWGFPERSIVCRMAAVASHHLPTHHACIHDPSSIHPSIVPPSIVSPSIHCPSIDSAPPRTTGPFMLRVVTLSSRSLTGLLVVNERGRYEPRGTGVGEQKCIGNWRRRGLEPASARWMSLSHKSWEGPAS